MEHLQAQLDDATRALHDVATDIAALDLYHHDHAAVQDKLQVGPDPPVADTRPDEHNLRNTLCTMGVGHEMCGEGVW